MMPFFELGIARDTDTYKNYLFRSFHSRYSVPVDWLSQEPPVFDCASTSNSHTSPSHAGHTSSQKDSSTSGGSPSGTKPEYSSTGSSSATRHSSRSSPKR
jgi:hypothetical protein